MARRSLLTGDERRRLFDLPVDDRDVARHYTLSPDDLKWIGSVAKIAVGVDDADFANETRA